MFKPLTFVLLFVFVFCDDMEHEKQNVTETNKSQTANVTKTDAATPGAQNPSNDKQLESVSEGLKAVTDGAKQIITGVIEVGSSLFSAITKWFDGGLRS